MSAAAVRHAFAGAVRCAQRGLQFELEGIERVARQPLRLLLVAGAPASLPAQLPDLELQRIAEAGAAPESWQLAWQGGACRLSLRSLHALREGDVALAAAMPGRAPSWRGRFGWALLLNLVRIPGLMRLLQSWRRAN